jgi:hypothetical protein
MPVQVFQSFGAVKPDLIRLTQPFLPKPGLSMQMRDRPDGDCILVVIGIQNLVWKFGDIGLITITVLNEIPFGMDFDFSNFI